MSKPIGVAVLAAALTLLAGAGRAQSVSETLGSTVAHRSCQQCHAIGLTGESPNAKAPHFRDLHQRFVIPDMQERLLEQLMLSHPDMPRFRLSAEEVTGLIAYLKAIQTDKFSYAPSPFAGNSVRQ